MLSSSEYTVNKALGYISLKSALQTDQVLAVAFEYTYRGQNYQVGEFSTDIKDNTQALFVKSIEKHVECAVYGKLEAHDEKRVFPQRHESTERPLPA